MADSSRTIMTDAGFALETRVRADETKMQFTRATISTDDHFSDTDDALAKLTELSNIQQDGKVTAVQVINTTTVYVQVDVNQAESKADYQMRSAALYAKDDDGTEVLYGVTVLQDPVFVHKDADGSYLGFGINTTVGRAFNVVVVVDPANMVTQQVFESTMKNYYTKAEVDAKFVTDDDFASKLPKNIATTDAANTFAKSQTFAGGATDGAGNAIATTKDVSDGDAETLKSAKDYADTKVSGKADDSAVVHTADMRKLANQVASIDEVNAKQDKIGYTPADDSTVLHNNSLNRITTDDSGIIVGNEQNFGIIKRSGSPAGIAVVSGKNFRFMATNDVVLSNNSSYHDVWNISPTGQISILDGAYFTPADDSKVVHNSEIDPSVIVKTTLTNTDNVLTLGAGTYWVWGTAPKNYPTSVPWGTVVVKLNPISTTGMNKLVEVTDTSHNRVLNTYSGSPATWSGWHIPNENSVVKDNGDDTVTINGKSYVPANAANVVDRNPDTGVVSEPVDFTKLTVNGGKSVATSDDLKSLEDASWLSLGTPLGDYLDITSGELVDTTFTGEPLFMKFDSATGTTKLSGGLLFSPIKDLNGHATWTGQLVTLPDGLDVSDDDVKSFITLLLNSNSTASTTLDSVTKSGQVISGTITYTGTPSGFKEGISLVGSVGANYRQYVTNLTTKLIKKI